MIRWILVFSLGMGLGGIAHGASAGSVERAAAPEACGDLAKWTDAWLPTSAAGQPAGNLPFSLTFGGKPFSEVAGDWAAPTVRRELAGGRVDCERIWRQPGGGLVIRCNAVEYPAYATVEWTLHFKNEGSADTPIIADIQSLDATFERGDQCEFTLHHAVGSPCKANDYEPLTTLLRPKTSKEITAAGGRPTNSDMPYFNIEKPGGGVIVVVGWPGQWAAKFERDDKKGLRIRAGQQTTHFVLHPGEEVRSPLMVLQFYRGDYVAAQNVWRRWMIEYNLPRPGGKLPPIEMAACSSHQFGEMIKADSASQKFFIDRYLEEKLPLDYWWMDAGWYWCKGNWGKTGTWEVDTDRFPGGLRSISDHAHAKGVKTIVWFEPERVTPGTWLYEKHPDWLLGKDGEQKLLNLGNPDARKWLTDHVDKLITEQGIDLYRQDFNMDPLAHWQMGDTPDRQGITENKHVTGYLAYWDELRRRHPDMLIDTCASGGRRNDLETLRRAVPLLRSDYIIEPVGNQGHTYGISFWIPYYGTGSGADDAYKLRSVLCPHFTACFDMRKKEGVNYAEIRRVLDQWKQFAPYMLGDYYPLTSYSLTNDVWIAWQFNRPETGEGMVQAFRRADSAYESARFKLSGLDAGAKYTVTDLDTNQPKEMTGRELMETGLLVTVPAKPAAMVITYRKAP